jgi:hypothetical protein
MPEAWQRRLTISVSRVVSATIAYTWSTTIVISGAWSWEYLATAILCFAYAKWVNRRRPLMLVLRGFGDPVVEALLQRVSAGMSIQLKAVYLHDRSGAAPLMFRSHVPSPTFYLARVVGWLAFAWLVVAPRPVPLAYRLCWAAWVVVGTSSFHRYKHGRHPKYWASCLAALVTTFTVHRFGGLPVGNPWPEVGAIAVVFCSSWAAWALVLTWPLQRLGAWLWDRSVIRTGDQVDKLAGELDGDSFTERYLRGPGPHTVEIVCTDETWARCVYEFLDYASLIVVEVSRLHERPALKWELSEARRRGRPLLMLCESTDVDRARHELEEAGFGPWPDLFVWHRDEAATYKARIDEEELVEVFLQRMDRAQFKETRYLPLPRSWADARPDFERMVSSHRPRQPRT